MISASTLRFENQFSVSMKTNLNGRIRIWHIEIDFNSPVLKGSTKHIAELHGSGRRMRNSPTTSSVPTELFFLPETGAYFAFHPDDRIVKFGAEVRPCGPLWSRNIQYVEFAMHFPGGQDHLPIFHGVGINPAFRRAFRNNFLPIDLT